MCSNCQSFATEENLWSIHNNVVCAHCFNRFTHENPYQYQNVKYARLMKLERALETIEERIEQRHEFDQLLHEIDVVCRT